MARSRVKLEYLTLPLIEQVAEDHSMIGAKSIEITIGHGN
jgi:hypothetical protein